jgi:hypothetical protein
MYKQFTAPPVENRGSSSIQGTEYLRSQLPELFKKHNIKSMFDAGANDCAWQYPTMHNMIEYSAGDHNVAMVRLAQQQFPDLNIIQHNIVVDPFPSVDVIFLRDVAIHLNNYNKKLMLKNWLQSNVPWILMTHIDNIGENKDFEHSPLQFPFAEINWHLPPWNFPKPTDSVVDLWPGSFRLMCLWHRDQIKELV